MKQKKEEDEKSTKRKRALHIYDFKKFKWIKEIEKRYNFDRVIG